MNRRSFLGTLASALLAAPLAAEAQQAAGKVPLIGFLDYGTPDPARLTWWKACGSEPLPPSGASSASAAAK
jgi:hypothetical protein